MKISAPQMQPIVETSSYVGYSKSVKRSEIHQYDLSLLAQIFIPKTLNLVRIRPDSKFKTEEGFWLEQYIIILHTAYPPHSDEKKDFPWF